jgi:hypothetical protein
MLHWFRRLARPRPAAKRPARLGLEALEDRLALSQLHPVVVLPPVKVAILSHEAAAVAAQQQAAIHNSPANVAARVALLDELAQQAQLKAAHPAAPPTSPAPAPAAPANPAPSQPSQGTAVSLQGTLRTNVAAIGGETTGVIIQTAQGTYELDFGNNSSLRNTAAALNGQQVQVTGNLTIQPGVEIPVRYIVHIATLTAVPQPAPTPAPAPIHPSPGEGSGINPATYVPQLCTTATFSGIMGADGHYSSFTIVGHNPATGTTVIISYSTGTPYGSPVYHWAVTVESQTLGNWGNAATVNQPYYVEFLPLPVTYQQPGYGP